MFFRVVFDMGVPSVEYVLEILLLFRSRLCHDSVEGAWWHLGFYESF
jgi:hypothetical protein